MDVHAHRDGRDASAPVAAAAHRGGRGQAPARPLVSVVVTTCNRARLLREALDSVLAQRGAGRDFDLEVIVVDGASTDSTLDVVAALPVTRYIRLPERRSIGAARNTGVGESRGRYVAFLDDDDLWLPEKLHLQVAALDAHPEAGAVYSRVVVRSDGREWVQPAEPDPPSGEIFEPLLRTNVCGSVLRFLIRRTALDQVGAFDETLSRGEDYDLWLRLAFQFPILFVPGHVGVYRPAPGGNRATTLGRGLDPREIRYIAGRATALLPDTPEHTALKEQARAWAEMRIVTQLAVAADPEAVLPHMFEAVRRCPAILGEPDVRDSLARTVRRCVRTSGAPLSRARAAVAALRASAGEAGPRRALERTMAAIWADAAVDLLRASPRDWRAWAAAAAQAVGHDPGHVIGRAFRRSARLLKLSRTSLRALPGGGRA